jgi:hypothetical protein
MTQRVLGVIGLVLHCTFVGFFYLITGLLAPMDAVAVLWVVWVGFLVVAVALVRRRSGWALAVPFAALAVWYGVLGFGEAVWHWTA